MFKPIEIENVIEKDYQKQIFDVVTDITFDWHFMEDTTFEKTDTGKLALVFVDCDSYRGTEYLIEKIFDHCLAVSGLMLFEDYGHASLLGNRLAVHKFFDRKKNAFCFFSQFSGTFIVCKTY